MQAGRPSSRLSTTTVCDVALSRLPLRAPRERAKENCMTPRPTAKPRGRVMLKVGRYYQRKDGVIHLATERDRHGMWMDYSQTDESMPALHYRLNGCYHM